MDLMQSKLINHNDYMNFLWCRAILPEQQIGNGGAKALWCHSLVTNLVFTTWKNVHKVKWTNQIVFHKWCFIILKANQMRIITYTFLQIQRIPPPPPYVFCKHLSFKSTINVEPSILHCCTLTLASSSLTLIKVVWVIAIIPLFSWNMLFSSCSPGKKERLNILPLTLFSTVLYKKAATTMWFHQLHF